MTTVSSYRDSWDHDAKFLILLHKSRVILIDGQLTAPSASHFASYVWLYHLC